jgi:Integrase core domain
MARSARTRAARAMLQNGFAESFIRRFRDECLNEHLFCSVAQARRIIER